VGEKESEAFQFAVKRFVKVTVSTLSVARCMLLTCAAFQLLGPLNAIAQDNWQLVWSDEFNGPANSMVNTGPEGWIYDLGHGYGCVGCPINWGTGEIEEMTNNTSNVSLDGLGRLRITPQRDVMSGWTSGRIETQRTDFRAPAVGVLAVEASIHQPDVTGAQAAGYWPAFWMLGAPFRGNYLNWPSVGEIDIMENINGRESVFGVLHCGVAPGGPCNEFGGVSSGERPCMGCKTGFHVYRVELDISVVPNQLRWYLDGNNYFTVNAPGGPIDPTTWSNATNHGFLIILNVAIGGGFPAAYGGGPTDDTLPGVPMLVDYVRVYTSSRIPTAPKNLRVVP
jgi:beta-glucanase (GH16 family)